jgi:hypothetical protein
MADTVSLVTASESTPTPVTRILHTNKKRDVILSGEATDHPVVIKNSEIERLLKSEWVTGSALLTQIFPIPDPLGIHSSISAYFSKPISFISSEISGSVEATPGATPVEATPVEATPGATPVEATPRYTITTSYLSGETMWTEISRGLSSKDAWKLVVQTLLILEQLRRHTIRFSHNDLHVGNVCVIRLPKTHRVVSPFPEIPFSFDTNIVPGIFDYDVSYLEGSVPPDGYYIESKRLERGLIPCAYDPLFDAATLTASTLFALHERGRPVGSERLNLDDFIAEPDAAALNPWMRRNGFTLRNRSYTYVDIPKMPWMKADIFAKVKNVYIPYYIEDDKLYAGHKRWCEVVTKRKMDTMKNRRDKDFCSIIMQISMFV